MKPFVDSALRRGEALGARAIVPSAPRCWALHAGSWVVGAALLMGGMGAVQAQTMPPEPRNVLHLSASGKVEVPQDWLTMVLAVTQEGRDARAVQQALQRKVDAALKAIKPLEEGAALKVQSGQFRVSPRHGDNSRIVGWQGRAELVLEGSDFARITQAAAQSEDLVVARMGFALSPQAQERVQAQAQAQAVEAFKQQAQQLAQQWGLSSYTLRELTLSRHSSQPHMRMQHSAVAMDAVMAPASAQPVPVEAGTAEVVVEVSGSVQMQ